MSHASQVDAQVLEQALFRHTLMFAKPEHPYYIMAPDYRDTSSGIVSLHYLCHVLNLNGREAYLCGPKVVNPNLKTPLLDAATEQRHQQHGKVAIAVYPEVVVGNPLGRRVVSRFLLNFEGLINGKSMEAAPTDLLFYYGPALAEKRGHANPDLLGLPVLDIDLFKAPPAGTPRRGCYLYQNRHPLEQIDYSLLPEGIQLLRIANALPLHELAQVLRSAEVMYSYEWSMTCVIAVLCGCPVIFMPGSGVDQAFLETGFLGSAGFALLDQPDALATARAGVEGALQRYVLATLPFWQQLDTFIAKTQAAAALEAADLNLGVLPWLRERHPDAQQLRLINERLDSQPMPVIGVLVLDDADDRQRLAATLASLGTQRCLYPHLEVSVLGNQSLADPQVRHVPCARERQAEAINTALQHSRCDWFLIVEAGVEFTASGLLIAALELVGAEAGCLAYMADEAMRATNGSTDIALRPDFNLDLLLSFPASLSRHWLYQRQALLQRGGFALDCARAFELEYQLRLVEQQGLGCVGHVAEPLLIGEALPLRDCAHERAVLERHLQARGYTQGQVAVLASSPGRYRLDYGHAQAASVSILIALEGSVGHFQRCIETLLENTALAGGFEVLLLAPSALDEAAREWLAMVEQIGGEQIQVLHYAAGQSRVAMCNHAAQQARGDFLLWLDARAGILARDWLQQLLNHAQRPEVGAVGAKLMAADGKVRHAGLVLGLTGLVGSAFDGVDHQQAGYMGRLQVDQDCSALSGECLMLRRALFLEAGGFAEDPLLARWVDVDLCLRLQEAGYLNVWTPHVQLLMDACERDAATTEQEDALLARWLPRLARDPAYNANLSLQVPGGFVRASNSLVWNPLKSWHPLPMLLAHPADLQGAGQQRIVEPFKALREAGWVDGLVTPHLLSAVELERYAPDTVLLQRPLDDAQLLAMRRLRAFSRAFKVLDVDGYLPQMRLQGAHAGFGADEISQRLQSAVILADRIIVPAPALAEVLAGQHDDVRVLEASLPGRWWRNLQGKRGMGSKPRVGWAGAVDADLLVDVVRTLAAEVEWVALGDCPEALRPYMKEVHAAVAPERQAAALAALNLDLALAPMAQSLLNACSGNPGLLEYAACGYPIICSNVPGFAGVDVLPLTRVANTTADWLAAIRLHLGDPQASASLGEVLQASVRRDWLLEGERLALWRAAWLAG
ncbi:glycosyltransferase [Pseudomonas sp. SD17-1]|jgi:hypothetical protein|uniref:glycosyltransferase n=1 Tax=unclassified Pseudomonas TaxID=196821 RepID=UPI0023645556|nr:MULTISPECIES: glycosyltransferase [unclassified Pseudomonas]MDD1957869.1 glycosyltransferase [Pseudomonas sp. 8209]WEJ23182.1 glycosyltransferase [Pseudomonas sp. SD17-1]